MATTPTVITSNGTPVEFIPLPTPFPAASGCSSYIYRQVDGHFLAWDPFYGASLDKNARSCFPPQMISWWSQTDATTTSTALGPTFVCPQAYSAVQTVLVASETQEVYCCPSEYSLFVVMPSSRGFPSQCVSKVEPGESVAFMSLDITSGVTTTTTTVSTIQKSSTITVFAVPINGFNIEQSTSTTSSASSSSDVATVSDQSSAASGSGVSGDVASSGASSGGGASTGAIVGASVGAVVAVLAAGVGAFAFWKRQRRRRRQQGKGSSGPEGWTGDTPPRTYYPPQHQSLGGYYSPQQEQFAGGFQKTELPAESKVYEMPAQTGGPR